MNPTVLKSLYPHASASTIRANEILEAQNSGQPVAELVRPEPQHREVQTLASGSPKQTGRKKRAGLCHVLIVRYGRNKLDDDNLCASYKALRDGIAAKLYIDDGDPRIKFDYDQVITKGAIGTHVLISTTPK